MSHSRDWSQYDIAEAAQLRADLATALRESRELIAQRDTALGLCKQRDSELGAALADNERLDEQLYEAQEELAAVTAQRDAFDLERRDMGDKLSFHVRAYDGERAAHAETKAARERLDQDWKRRHSAWLGQQAREVAAHAETRRALENMRVDEQLYIASIKRLEDAGEAMTHLLQIQSEATESTRADLAKSEALVKELEDTLDAEREQRPIYD